MYNIEAAVDTLFGRQDVRPEHQYPEPLLVVRSPLTRRASPRLSAPLRAVRARGLIWPQREQHRMNTIKLFYYIKCLLPKLSHNNSECWRRRVGGDVLATACWRRRVGEHHLKINSL